jgi:hypothetical protein
VRVIVPYRLPVRRLVYILPVIFRAVKSRKDGLDMQLVFWKKMAFAYTILVGKPP